jgi:hypothetical protein
VARWEDVEGVKVAVSGSVDMKYSVAFNGLHGGGEVVK